MNLGWPILLLKNNFFKPFFQLCVYGLLVFVFSACVRSSPSKNVHLKNTFRFVISAEPPTLDWNKAVDTTSGLILDNIMEGLVDYDFSHGGFSHGGLRPALAKKWFSSKNQKYWTFILKKNVQWSDGVQLKAQHFLDSWERLLNPQTASEYAYFLYVIKNAKLYNQGKIKDFSQVGVQVLPSGALKVELEEGKSYFPYFLAHSSTYPIRKDLIKKYGSQWTKAQFLVSLGAYQLKKWVHDYKIILERNNLYYQKKAFVKQVVIYIIVESATALNLFDYGRLDAVKGLPSRELSLLRKKEEYHAHDILAIYYYGINTQQKPFDDVRVRRAFNYAVSRPHIIQLLQGGQTALSGWLPKGLLGYTPSAGLGFNPLKAQKLLASAGYAHGEGFPKVGLSYNSGEDNKRMAESLQAQLKKVLNVQVELSGQEWKTYLRSLSRGRYALYRLGWRADYPDPHTFMNLMTSDSTNNHTFWKNKKYDLLVKQAASLPNGRLRRALYKQAEQLLTQHFVPVIPIYSAREHWLIHKRVLKFPFNAMGRIHFKEVVLN